MIHGESQFPILQHGAPVLIRFFSFAQLRSKQGISIEKDRRKAHEDAVFFAHFCDRIFNHCQVVAGFLCGRWAKSQCFKKVVDSALYSLIGDFGVLLHQLVNRGQLACYLRVVDDRRGQSAEISGRLDFVVSFGVVRDLFRHADNRHRTVGHVAQNVLRFVEDLSRLGTIDGVKVGVVFKTVLPS